MTGMTGEDSTTRKAGNGPSHSQLQPDHRNSIGVNPWGFSKLANALVVIIPSIYVCGFLALNSHLLKHGLYDYSIANAHYLAVGGLYVSFLVIWYLFAGRNIISLSARIKAAAASGSKHHPREFWIVVELLRCAAETIFFLCLSAAFFSSTLSDRSGFNGFWKYLVLLFLVEYPIIDRLNIDMRYPRINQLFILLTRVLAIYLFYSISGNSATTFIVFIHIVAISFGNYIQNSRNHRLTDSGISCNIRM